jgi:2-methylisocitrate lyase-like PEP mutase family enzyme
MPTSSQAERATRFGALHRPGTPFVLANAWDAASARIFAEAGFPAIGTTSAGVAWSLGFADKERLPVDLLLAAVNRMAAVIAVPLSVDIERGYGHEPGEVAAVVRQLIAAGAVGVNIEDGTDPPDVLCRKIEALRSLASETGVRLFINARTDLYLRGDLRGAERCAEATRRLTRYAEAGADGAFAPGLADLAEIAQIASAVPRPLNIYAGAGVPAVSALAAAGVARISVGCGPMQATLGLTRRIAEELLQSGTYTLFTDGAIPSGEMNKLFRRD